MNSEICKKNYLSCVPGVDGKIHPSGFMQQGNAALRPRDGFSHPHHEHMKDTYKIMLISGTSFMQYPELSRFRNCGTCHNFVTLSQ